METYFNTKELSKYLKIPEQSIRRWVLNNEIPYRRIHNVIRYRLSEIEKWVETNKNRLSTNEKKGNENELFNTAENLNGVDFAEVKNVGEI